MIVTYKEITYNNNNNNNRVDAQKLGVLSVVQWWYYKLKSSIKI